MKIGIVGCAGRMGHMLVREILATDGCALAGGTEALGSDMIGRDVAEIAGAEASGLAVGEDAAALFQVSDTVIDFTIPVATARHAVLAADMGRSLIVGTTGLDADHLDALASASDKAVIVQAANMSVGVNVLLGLTEQVAGVLGDDYDIEIVEMHHRHKVDAPSGTALKMGEVIANALGRDLSDCAVYGREGKEGPRDRQTIGFSSIRGGDVVGEHTVTFFMEGERVEITHKASSRMTYANGAVKASQWLTNQPNGLYSMQDVLDL